MRPPARVLQLGDPPEPWRALGLAVGPGGRLRVGDLGIELTGEGGGVLALEVEGMRGERPDGLPIMPAGAGRTAPAEHQGPHALGAVAVDHLVAFTGDVDRTAGALVDAGLDLRRRREPPAAPVPQAFFNLATTVLELAEAHDPPRFWGLTLVVSDLGAAAARLGSLLGGVRDAVQPGRRIAPVRREAGLGVALALMTPRAPTGL
jgi:hypothetical protein